MVCAVLIQWMGRARARAKPNVAGVSLASALLVRTLATLTIEQFFRLQKAFLYASEVEGWVSPEPATK